MRRWRSIPGGKQIYRGRDETFSLYNDFARAPDAVLTIQMTRLFKGNG